MTLGKGRGDQPPPPHAWTGSLIAEIFQECLEERITKAMVLSPGEEILIILWEIISQRGAPSWKSKRCCTQCGISSYLGGREVQGKTTVNIVQDGCHATADAVVEKRMKNLGPEHPRGKKKTNQTTAVACNIEEWMQGIEENDYKVELRN